MVAPAEAQVSQHHPSFINEHALPMRLSTPSPSTLSLSASLFYAPGHSHGHANLVPSVAFSSTRRYLSLRVCWQSQRKRQCKAQWPMYIHSTSLSIQFHVMNWGNEQLTNVVLLPADLKISAAIFLSENHHP